MKHDIFLLRQKATLSKQNKSPAFKVSEIEKKFHRLGTHAILFHGVEKLTSLTQKGIGIFHTRNTLMPYLAEL